MPLILWWIPTLLFFGWGGIITLTIGEFKLALYEIGIVLFPIPLLFLAYFADRISKTVFVRGFIIYGFWFIVVFITCFVFLAALGGVSMAAVDNPNGWPERYAFYIDYSLKGILFAQPILFILTTIGLYRIKTFTKHRLSVA